MPIGPSTVATGFDVDATAIEQQRKVFKNPRGQGYYYALIEYSIDTKWYFYKSLDGITWFNTDVWTGGTSPSICILEDSANTRLVVWLVKKYSDSICLNCYEIDDEATNPSALFSNSIVVQPTDVAVHKPSITLDSSDYLWVTWTDEFTNKGKKRNKLRAVRSIAPYPTTLNWGVIVDVYGEKGSADYPDGIRCNDGPFLRSELVPLTAEADVGVVFSYVCYALGHTKLKACTLNFTTQIDEGTMVPLDDTVHADLIHSSVAESGVNSDVFIGYKALGGEFNCLKWDVSEASLATFGTVFALAVDSLALSIDKNASPNKIYYFYVKNADNTDFHYNITEVNSFSLEGETEVDDGAAELLDYLSASYQDWDLDGDVQIIYTRQTNNIVRFWAVGVEEAPPVGWKQLEYFTEPPTGGQWNRLRYASEPPVAAAWNKLKYKA